MMRRAGRPQGEIGCIFRKLAVRRFTIVVNGGRRIVSRTKGELYETRDN